MDELRCPMCGKPNPANIDICQHCQARLKPLLGGLPSEGAKPVTPESPDQTQTPSSDQDSMDEWLSFLRQSEDTTDSEAQFDDSSSDWVEGEQDGEFPDWLNELGSESDTAEPTSVQEDRVVESEDEEQPEWLQKIRTLRATDTDGEPEAELEPPGETEDVLGFLTEEDIDRPPEITSEDMGDEWLTQLREEDIPVTEQDEVPDWLIEEPSIDVFPSPVEPKLEDEPAQIVEEEEDSGEAAGGEVSVSDQVEEDGALESPPPSEDEIPDWMAGIVAGAAGAEAAIDVDADIDGLPDWLSDLEKSSALEHDEIIPFGEEGDELTFDWLQAQVRADQDISFGDSSPTEGVGATADSGAVGPFIGDLSDFLEEAELSTLDTGEPLTEETGPDLAPADLPTWLEAMRPVEAAAAGIYALDDKDAPVESSGPLAGLQGVLPAEPEIAQLKKPVAYALRLQVSENQQAHADLFDDLVKSEGELQAIAGRPVISSQYIYRLIIFVVLLLAIAWPVLTGSQVVPLPGLLPETFDTSDIITDLPDNPLVLLAVDYDPGLAGEMEATASVVVDHLMLKGAYFALVSTTPNGPALGERLVKEVSARGGHSYQDIDQYANLGYIPGGAIGLQGFAKSPPQVLPYALDPESTRVWTKAPMDQARVLADFNLVAVVSDDPDRARAWIEQVQPTLDTTPLIMVISSQAEPLIRPYYQAIPKQVQGMVVGLAGGGSYENAHQDLAARSGKVRSYWDSYTLSMLVAAVLIGVGGVVNIFANLLDARKQSDKDAKP